MLQAMFTCMQSKLPCCLCGQLFWSKEECTGPVKRVRWTNEKMQLECCLCSHTVSSKGKSSEILLYPYKKTYSGLKEQFVRYSKNSSFNIHYQHGVKKQQS